MSLIPASIPAFSGSKSTYGLYRVELLNSANSYTEAHPNGLSGFLLSLKEYNASISLPAETAFSAIADPGPRPPYPGNDATAAALRNSTELTTLWTYQSDRYGKQQKSIASFKALFFASLDPTSKVLVGDGNGSTQNCTIQQMLASLDAVYGRVTAEDLTANILKLHVPYVASEPFLTYAFMHTQCHVFAARHSNPIPESEKIRLLKAGLSQCGLFDGPISLYRRDNPNVADQSFAKLLVELQDFAYTIPANSTPKGAGFVHAAIDQPPQPTDLELILKALAAIAPQIQPSTTRARRAPTDPRPELYCWTHGLKATHSSHDCLYPAVGHKSTATADNKMKGKETEFIHRSQRNRRDRPI
jgi:hypothetical protein